MKKKKNEMKMLLQLLLFLIATSSFCLCKNETVVDCNKIKCPTEINVNWMNMAPYVYSDGIAGNIYETNGTLKVIVEEIIGKCCFGCTKFNYLNPVDDAKKLNNRISANITDLSFPVYGLITTTNIREFSYFPVINSPGIIFMQKIETDAQTNKMIVALGKSWPIGVLILIFAILSGFVIWVLDSRKNPKDFPQYFVPGMWDGFWWAFVSMTTVGYGDKAPVWIFSRIFAFFWCLIGMVIISIFTSTLSTQLTSDALEKVKKLYGLRVVGINNTKEYQYGTSQNAVMVPVRSVDELIAKLKNDKSNDTLSGALIDAFVAGHDAGKFQDTSFMRFSHVEEHDFMYGFTISNSLVNNVSSDFTKCVRRELSAEEENIFFKIQQNMLALPKPNKTETQKSLIDKNSNEFRMTCIVCAILFVVFYLLSAMWYFLYYKPKHGKNKRNKEESRKFPNGILYGDVVITQFFDIERLMVKEVTNFYHAFKDRIEYMREMYIEDYTKPAKPLPNEIDLSDTWMFYDIYPDEEFPEKIEKKQHFDAIQHDNFLNTDVVPTNFLNTDDVPTVRKYAILSKSAGDVLKMSKDEKPDWAKK